jgi:hypothetical protein
MAVYTEVSGRIVERTVRGSLAGLMELSMKESGLMGSTMVRES